MDLSKLSTEDLMALKSGDLTKVSDAGLMALRAPAPLKADPTGTTSENAWAGAGKAVADTGRGIVQRSAEILSNAPNSLPILKGLSMLMEKAGFSPSQVSAQAKANTAETRRLDAPLMDTTAGKVGNFAGNAALLAPATLLPGANTVTGGGIIGGASAAVQPTTTPQETAINTTLGFAGGAAGQAIANKVPQLLQARIDNRLAQQAANAQKFGAAQRASAQGYVIPPADLEPGILSEALSGLSGKIKTAQVASQRNQQVTDRLAREAIGLRGGDELTANVLQNIRNQAATQGYAPIRNAGTVKADQAFFNALDNIAATQQGASRSFPGLGETGVVDLVHKLKQPTFDASDAIDATRVLREAADKAYRQGDKTLGKAAKSAADALEDVLDRHLTATGNADALGAFREARKLIAKTYTVQKGLNEQTGSVAAGKLTKDLAKMGADDPLRVIAETAGAFPKATQALQEAPKAVSPLDFAVATTTGAATGNPMAALMLGARPIARNVLLSGPVQKRAMKQTLGLPMTQATQAVLDNRMMQMMLAPAGVAGGLQLAQQ